MASRTVIESVVEDAALSFLAALGAAVECGVEIAVGGWERPESMPNATGRAYIALCAERVPSLGRQEE